MITGNTLCAIFDNRPSEAPFRIFAKSYRGGGLSQSQLLIKIGQNIICLVHKIDETHTPLMQWGDDISSFTEVFRRPRMQNVNEKRNSENARESLKCTMNIFLRRSLLTHCEWR